MLLIRDVKQNVAVDKKILRIQTQSGVEGGGFQPPIYILLMKAEHTSLFNFIILKYAKTFILFQTTENSNVTH